MIATKILRMYLKTKMERFRQVRADKETIMKMFNLVTTMLITRETINSTHLPNSTQPPNNIQLINNHFHNLILFFLPTIPLNSWI